MIISFLENLKKKEEFTMTDNRNPDIRDSLERLQEHITEAKELDVNVNDPDDVKYEIAKEHGIPLKKGEDNGDLTAKQAGFVGGFIGGNMVKELVQKAEESLIKD